MGIADIIRSVLSKEPEETAEDWEQREKDRPTQAHQDAEIAVTGTMEISGVGTVVTARITDGVLGKKDCLRFENGETAEVETIELHHSEVEKAEEGNVVGLELVDIDTSRVSEGDKATTETE
ncbi:MAG: hypothetical protein U5J64_12460 [Halobacteriales archaeon]|nr:hypothetical protein [Halobacteriales archaeon]